MILLETLLIIFALIFWILYSFSFIKFKNLLKFFLFPALLFQVGWIVERTIISSHAPFSNAYESMIFFSFLIFVKILFTKNISKKLKYFLMIIPEVLLLASLLLPGNLKQPNLLVPALQSAWMFIHVPAFFIGYTSLSILFVLSLAEIFTKKDYSDSMGTELKQSFFFITLGIITGSIWAEEAWANFWSWDPKEVWALITWIFLLVIFHVKLKKIKNIFVILAFISMVFTYFGVMFLLPGLHAYK